MSDFINSPPLPQPTHIPPHFEFHVTLWQRDQLKLALDEMAMHLNEQYYKDATEILLAKHGYLPRKEPK